MPATKQLYTAAATWTAAQLADVFRDAFIDAGLMSAWHDSFLADTIEHRVLEVVYDATKTYGKTYYWFQFTTVFSDDARVQICTGWNTSSHIPAGPSGAGTQYLDWLATAGMAGHRQILGTTLSTTVNAILTRYTSSGQSWFTLHQGATYRCFGIVPPAHAVRSWIDLDRVVFSGYMEARARASSNSGSVMWAEPLMLRRSHNGAHLRGETDVANYGAVAGNNFGASLGYYGPGNITASAVNNSSGATNTSPLIRLPIYFNNTNPAYSADTSPVFHSLPYSSYVTSTLPADFGVAFHYPENTMSRGDKLIVSAGVEEWEIIDRANNSTVTTGASPLFLARVV